MRPFGARFALPLPTLQAFPAGAVPMRMPYRREGETWQIDLQLERLQQLVNRLDPAPVPGRDLDPAAERYILDAARELPAGEPLALLL